MATYRVEPGDTWGHIARIHDVDQSAVCAANSADGSTALYPGQELVLPRGAKKAGADPVFPLWPDRTYPTSGAVTRVESV